MKIYFKGEIILEILKSNKGLIKITNRVRLPKAEI